jgi:hypothetical protein
MQASATSKRFDAAEIQLPSRTSLRELDFAIGPVSHNRTDTPANLIIDLSGVQFILLECLAALIAEIGARQKLGLTSLLRLPQSRDLYEFLEEWNFPDALQQISGIPFSDFIIRSDITLLEEHKRAHQTSVRYGLEETYVFRDQQIRVRKPTKRFWSFRYWDTADFQIDSDPSRFKRAVLDESERWADDAVVREILIRHLGKYHPYVSSHVVHEAMSNAFRHGKAESVLSVSQGQFDKKSKRDRVLTIVFWDDGIPTYRTLRHRLDQNQSIEGSAYKSSPELKYWAHFDGVPQLKSSKELPKAHSSDQELMLASVYPGISSDPEGSKHFVHPRLKEHAQLTGSDGSESLPGRGLANLINGAVDVLGGHVTFRCGEHFMTIEPAAKTAKGVNYAVELERRHPFPGNLITIRLPLQDVRQ